VESANDGLRFVLELGVLASLAYWALTSHTGVRRWVLALGAPLLAAVVWAVFVNPAGAAATGDPARLLLEGAVFGSGAAAMLAVGRSRLALTFVAVAAVHLVLTFALDQR
jgi:hypothetical protein